jgi:hypothetical protein
MIQYTGEGDQYRAIVVIFGDGHTNAIDIDLAAAPFNIKFSSMKPVRVVVLKDSPDLSPTLDSAEVVQNILKLNFGSTPPPETNFDFAKGYVGVPRTKLDAYFVYETAPI